MYRILVCLLLVIGSSSSVQAQQQQQQQRPANCTQYWQPCVTSSTSGYVLDQTSGNYVCQCNYGYVSADPCLNDCSVYTAPGVQHYHCGSILEDDLITSGEINQNTNPITYPGPRLLGACSYYKNACNISCIDGYTRVGPEYTCPLGYEYTGQAPSGGPQSCIRDQVLSSSTGAASSTGTHVSIGSTTSPLATTTFLLTSVVVFFRIFL